MDGIAEVRENGDAEGAWTLEWVSSRDEAFHVVADWTPERVLGPWANNAALMAAGGAPLRAAMCATACMRIVALDAADFWGSVRESVNLHGSADPAWGQPEYRDRVRGLWSALELRSDGRSVRGWTPDERWAHLVADDLGMDALTGEDDVARWAHPHDGRAALVRRGVLVAAVRMQLPEERGGASKRARRIVNRAEAFLEQHEKIAASLLSTYDKKFSRWFQSSSFGIFAEDSSEEPDTDRAGSGPDDDFWFAD